MGVKGAAAILLLSGAIFLAGCGGSTQTVTQVAQTVTATETVTQTSSPAAPAAPRGHSFSGNGTEELGTVTVHAPSTITWHCDGCAAFALTSHVTGTEAINVGSSASGGTSHVDPGTYPDTQVISNGSWSVVISPG